MNISPVAKLGQIALEEEVRGGSYHRDGAELPDLLPAWRDRGRDDVGRELEGEAGDEPASVADQDLAEPAVRSRRGKCWPQSGEECLGGSDGDNDQRHRIDDDNDVFGDELRPLLHRRPSEPHGAAAKNPNGRPLARFGLTTRGPPASSGAPRRG